jgi:superfamily I DNA/RNA helicase
LENRMEALGVEAGGRLFVGTVHSFSLTQVVLPYANLAGLGLPDEFSVGSRAERSTAIEAAFARVIGGPRNATLENRMLSYRRSFLDRSSEEWRARDPQLAELVEAYEDELRSAGLIDFDDMPLLAVKALRDNKWIQRALQAKYPVLAVDEYQDLGRALHRMVMGLCFSAGMRLFAVGDVDQSIYGFAGAHPELLQQLSERDDVQTVYLKFNYRSGSHIVEASSYALGKARGYQTADDADEGRLYFHPQHGQYRQQADFLFSSLLPEIQSRLPELRLQELAVLYPAAWIGDSVAEAAQSYGYTTTRTDGKSIYPRGSRLMRWLELCATWCSGGWRKGSPRFGRLVSEARRIFAEAFVTEQDLLTFRRNLVRTLWKRRDPSLSLHGWLVELRAAVLQDLVEVCRTLRDDEEILTECIERTREGEDCADMVLGQFAGQSEGNDSINLSTLHSSKGREFLVVILFGIDDGRLPRANSSARERSEARRLFYVGFTRAEAELHIVFSASRASPFVTEVMDRLEGRR